LLGVRHIHLKGLFHFDLKLENIMFDGPLELANADSWVKVVDFGCVTSVLKQKNGFKNYSKGTPCYNAPEIHNK
jgi:serine/threonine protein kinase